MSTHASPPGLVVAVDVAYTDVRVTAAAAGVSRGTGGPVLFERIETSDASVAPYAPGAFFRRELPRIEGLLRRLPVRVDVVLVDGYVDLAPGRPCLGRHLRAALETRPRLPWLGEALPAVVGVAKTRFSGADHAVEVRRGGSQRPLFVTADGLDPRDAGRAVAELPGPHRIPDLLRRVDRLARGLAPPEDPLADRFLYKIVERSEWTALDPETPWRGTALDQRDGFIHLSRRSQLEGTLAKHFPGRGDLALVTLDLHTLPDLPILWEPSRGGALFPHLYAPLEPGRAAAADPIERDERGGHLLPPPPG